VKWIRFLIDLDRLNDDGRFELDLTIVIEVLVFLGFTMFCGIYLGSIFTGNELERAQLRLVLLMVVSLWFYNIMRKMYCTKLFAGALMSHVILTGIVELLSLT
jgi:hypothetical protein